MEAGLYTTVSASSGITCVPPAVVEYGYIAASSACARLQANGRNAIVAGCAWINA